MKFTASSDLSDELAMEFSSRALSRKDLLLFTSATAAINEAVTPLSSCAQVALQILPTKSTGLSHIDYVGTAENSYFGLGVSFGNAIFAKSCHTLVNSCHILMEAEEGNEEL
eukprot:6171810-Ditylum_brightwellii.AAC.1